MKMTNGKWIKYTMAALCIIGMPVLGWYLFASGKAHAETVPTKATVQVIEKGSTTMTLGKPNEHQCTLKVYKLGEGGPAIWIDNYGSDPSGKTIFVNSIRGLYDTANAEIMSVSYSDTKGYCITYRVLGHRTMSPQLYTKCVRSEFLDVNSPDFSKFVRETVLDTYPETKDWDSPKIVYSFKEMTFGPINE